MPQDPRERRKHVRRAVLLPCRVEGADTRGPMQVIDLSEGGCFVATTDRYAAGVQLTLQIRLGVSQASRKVRCSVSKTSSSSAPNLRGLA